MAFHFSFRYSTARKDELMGTSETGTRIGIVSSSGMLRATIPPRRSWLLILLEIAVFLVGAIWVYGLWARMSFLFHVLFIWGFVSASLAMITNFLSRKPLSLTRNE